MALLLIWLFFPNQLPAFIAILPVLAGLIVIPKNKRLLHIGFALVAVSSYHLEMHVSP